ncbi:hypothetical protein D3C73_1576030 [compost metagenome]
MFSFIPSGYLRPALSSTSVSDFFTAGATELDACLPDSPWEQALPSTASVDKAAILIDNLDLFFIVFSPLL